MLVIVKTAVASRLSKHAVSVEADLCLESRASSLTLIQITLLSTRPTHTSKHNELYISSTQLALESARLAVSLDEEGLER
jgi:hypothetical protein